MDDRAPEYLAIDETETEADIETEDEIDPEGDEEPDVRTVANADD